MHHNTTFPPSNCPRIQLGFSKKLLTILYCCSTLILSRRSFLSSCEAARFPFGLEKFRRALPAGTTNARSQRNILTKRGGSSSRKVSSSSNNKNNTGDPHADYTSMMHDNFDRVIGGGAINEKKRTYLDRENEMETDNKSSTAFQGTHNQAHFLHAMEGLDRYPNYLAKWDEDDVEELEQALQQRLDKVREQRQNAQSQRDRLKKVVDDVCRQDPSWKHFLEAPQSWDDVRQSGILDDRVSRAIFRSKFFRSSKNYTNPSLQEVVHGVGGAKVDLDAGYLEEIMDEEVTDVYSFPLLSESFCTKLQAYVRRVVEEIDKSKDPDFVAGGQRRVRNLDNLGLDWLNDLLFHLVVRPISRHLYQETEMGGASENNRVGDLDWRHGFIAAYAADPNQHQPRQRLVPHTDDSEVTLNICIGDVFEGGHLKFWGLRGSGNADGLLGEYSPEPGRALLHAGRQLHEVSDITTGDRFALIMWTRSWNGIRSTTCPCCWLNRRGSDNGVSSDSCICSARWN